MRYFLFIFFTCLAANAQDNPIDGAVRFIKQPLQVKVVDTTAYKIIGRRATGTTLQQGRLVKYSWAELKAYFQGTASTPNLQQVTTAGNTTTLPITIGAPVGDNDAVRKVDALLLSGNTNVTPMTGIVYINDGGSPLGLRGTSGGGYSISTGSLLMWGGDNAGTISKQVTVKEEGVTIGSSLPNGIKGDAYYGANYTANSFVQKQYVDNLLSNTFSLTTNKDVFSITYNGSNNVFTLSKAAYNTENLIFINGVLLNETDYTISGTTLTVSGSLLTSGASYYVSAAYQSPLSNTYSYAPNVVTVATYADMVASTQPTQTTFYRVIADENKNYPNTVYIWYADGRRSWVASTNDN